MDKNGLNKSKSPLSKSKEEKFKQLFLAYHSMLYRYGTTISVCNQLVEDCIQELFIYLYEKEIDLDSIKNIKAYLFTALRRKILENKNKLALTTTPSEEESSIEELLIAQEERKQKRELINNHLDNLPWRQKEAIHLKFFNNLSAKEIAEIMDITPQVVSNTVYKAIKKLKDVIFKSPVLPILFLFLTFS